jgi:exodeoxyribonuclease-3
MKVATFNINNINKRLNNLLDWLRIAEPDVVCLQELKATDAEFPADALRRAGYDAVWRGQKSWNGVAILARGTTPILTRSELPGSVGNAQSRYIEAAVKGVIISSLYAPNGNPQPGPKFNYKLAWLNRLAAHAANLYAADVPVVLAGDYNVVPTDRDIYPTKSWAKDALVQPESRAAFRRLLEQGWVDAIRELHPDAPMYTYWDYMRKRWERDGGLRIDLLMLSTQSAKRLKDAGVDREVRGAEGASDHAPAWVVLRNAAKSRRNSSQIRRGQQTASSQPRAQRAGRPQRRPLLIIDGDSFAHRASRPSEVHRSARWQGRWRPCRLCQLSAATLAGGASACPAGWLGYADRTHLPAQEIPCVPKRAPLRRRIARTARCSAGACCRVRL